MKSKITTTLLLLIILTGCLPDTEKVDILIRNGIIYDGYSPEPLSGVIAIAADTIYFVGDPGDRKFLADMEIDAEGLVVSPGFIDPHTHSLGDLLSASSNSNIHYLTQGVTTVFVGNDGDGPYQIEEKASELMENGIGTNAGFFIGHGSVRKAVLGDEDIKPTDEQLNEMRQLVNKGMVQGAFGLSTGLYYAPGSFAKTDEIVELAKEIVPFDGVYDSHIRDESSYTVGLMAAVEEAIEIGEKSGARVNFAHIKALGVDVWGKSEEVIGLIEEAQSNGLTITADQYPWQASGTHLENALVNRWVMNGGEELYYRRLNDKKLLPRIKEEMRENLRKRGGPSSILITADCQDTSLIGYNLMELSERLAMDPVDIALNIVRDGGARIASFNMNMDDIENFMQQPWVMTSSDGTKGHPRKYASFPKKYAQFVLERETLSIGSFINKSTGLVASSFGIDRRGTLKKGHYADISIWSPSNFKPAADFSNPKEFSEGVEFVIVNGQMTIYGGEYEDGLYGTVLKK